MDAIPALLPIPRPAVARHEAGHVVLQFAFRRQLKGVSLSEHIGGQAIATPGEDESLETEAAVRLAGPLSQMLAYPSSLGPYQGWFDEHLLLDPDPVRILPLCYENLGWGPDLNLLYRGLPMHVSNLHALDLELRAYLLRPSIAAALLNIENALLTNQSLEPSYVLQTLEGLFLPNDYDPTLCRHLRRMKVNHTIPPVSGP